MSIQLFLLLSWLTHIVGFNGRYVVHRATVSASRNFGTHLKMEPKDDEDRKSKYEGDTKFSSKIRDLSNDREFVLYLKAAAQKRMTLSRSDRRQVADELLRRVSTMNVHSVSDVLWSIGTLKLPTKNNVRDNRNIFLPRSARILM
jgi:hypothetical protein